MPEPPVTITLNVRIGNDEALRALCELAQDLAGEAEDRPWDPAALERRRMVELALEGLTA